MATAPADPAPRRPVPPLFELGALLAHVDLPLAPRLPRLAESVRVAIGAQAVLLLLREEPGEPFSGGIAAAPALRAALQRSLGRPRLRPPPAPLTGSGEEAAGILRDLGLAPLTGILAPMAGTEVIAVPVPGQRLPAGVIVALRSGPVPFGADAPTLAEDAALRLAPAAEARRLRRRGVQDRAALDRIQRVTAELLAAITSEDVARALTRTAPGGPGRTATAVARLDAGARVLTVLASRHHHYPPGSRVPRDCGDSALWQAVGAPGEVSTVEHPALSGGVSDEAMLMVAAPLVVDGTLWGALEVALPASIRRRARALVRTLAAQGEVALARAVLYERERESSLTLQRSLLPPGLPVLDGLELASRYLPGPGTKVGGDFYDVFVTGTGTWAILGDVCGKGPEATAVTVVSRTACRMAARTAHSPGRVLHEMNEILLAEHLGSRFLVATLIHLVREGRGIALRLARAGLDDPWIRRTDGRVERVAAPFGQPIGILLDPGFPELAFTLSPGEVLVLATDGATEARGGRRSPAIARAELDRAIGRGPADPELVCARLMAAVWHHTGQPPQDDVALLALRATPVPAGTRPVP